MSRSCLRSSWWLLAPVAAALFLAAQRGERRSGPAPDTCAGLAAQATELERQRVSIRRRTLLRARIIDDVLMGRLSLFEAAAMYQVVDGLYARPDWNWFRKYCAGDSDEERYCREVIRWVDLSTEKVDGGCLNGFWVTGLEHELEKALRRGPLRLPEARPDQLPDIDTVDGPR
jgi:hypothetical protein